MREEHPFEKFSENRVLSDIRHKSPGILPRTVNCTRQDICKVIKSIQFALNAISAQVSEEGEVTRKDMQVHCLSKGLRCDQTFTNDTAEQWDTSLLPLTHALYIQEMTSCWVSLGFGAQLAICICHFERVTLAYIYFYRRFIPSNHDLLVMRRCIIWALKHLQTERNDALSALKKRREKKQCNPMLWSKSKIVENSGRVWFANTRK